MAIGRIGAIAAAIAVTAISYAVRFRAGTVLMLTGRVLIKSPGQAQRDLSAFDLNKPLFVGDRILCVKGGKLKVRQRDGSVRMINSSSTWFQLGLVRTKEEDALYVALTGGDNPLRAANRPAVKPKSQTEPSVPDHDEVPCSLFRVDLPFDFPKDSTVQVSFRATDSAIQKAEAFFRGTASGSSLRSSKLQKALETFRNKGTLGPFSVEALRKDGAPRILQNVFLMAADKETSLLLALSQAEKAGDEYAKCLCRVSVLKKFGLQELAQEQFAKLPGP